MKAIETYEEMYNMGKYTLVEFMMELAETHYDGIKDAIEFYFVRKGYFDSVAKGLYYYDNN